MYGKDPLPFRRRPLQASQLFECRRTEPCYRDGNFIGFRPVGCPVDGKPLGRFGRWSRGRPKEWERKRPEGESDETGPEPVSIPTRKRGVPRSVVRSATGDVVRAVKSPAQHVGRRGFGPPTPP